MRQSDARKFLFVLWDGGGNVPPQLAIARGLTKRGHRVFVLGPASVRRSVEDAGAVFKPYRFASEHDSRSPERDLIKDWEPRTPLGVAARIRDRVLFGPSSLFAKDTLAVMEGESIDTVVADFVLFGAYLAAERAGVPLVSLVHSIYPFPATGLPAFGMGLLPADSGIARLRDRVLNQVTMRVYEAGRKQLNEARTSLGLNPLRSVFDLLDIPKRLLVLSSAAFDYPAILPANVRYIGAPRYESPEASNWQSPWPASDQRPLVLVSLSTTYQDQSDLLRRLVAAVSELPVKALVTVGPALDIEQFPSTANVSVQRFVPHSLVLPSASLVVTHAGHGTVMAALLHGVPLLCTPLGRDQFDVSARVAWRGVGIKVASGAIVRTLRDGMKKVLDDQGYASRAKQLSKQMLAENAVQSAVETLEIEASKAKQNVG
jgi:MGT family glycosyltransferase